jgi:hypothetical protein
LGLCTTDPHAFVRDVWGRSCSLDPGLAGRYQDVFSLAGVDELITERGLRVPAVRMARQGEILPPSAYTRRAQIGHRAVDDLVDAGRVATQLQQGATLIFQALHRYWGPIARFANRLALELQHPVQVNGYVTPPGSRGFDIHFDSHDVFVLQCHGSKHWEVFGEVVRSALPGDRRSIDEAEAGDLTISDTLENGASLYMPRGWAHRARTTGESSVHLTVGILVSTWMQPLQEVWRRIESNPSVKETVDAEQVGATWPEMRRQIVHHLDEVDTGSLRTSLRDRLRRHQSYQTPGVLDELLNPRDIANTDRFVSRDLSFLALSKDAGRVIVEGFDRSISFPETCWNALDLVATGRPFSPPELVGALTADDVSVLLRRLLREGFVIRTLG